MSFTLLSAAAPDLPAISPPCPPPSGTSHEHPDSIAEDVYDAHLNPVLGTLERAREFERFLLALDVSDSGALGRPACQRGPSKSGMLRFVIIVSGVLAVDPSFRDRLVVLARDMAVRSMEEPGCRLYGLWAHPDRPGEFRIFEEWDSQDALTEHFATPHFAAFGAALGEGGLIDMAVHRYIDPEVAELF